MRRGVRDERWYIRFTLHISVVARLLCVYLEFIDASDRQTAPRTPGADGRGRETGPDRTATGPGRGRDTVLYARTDNAVNRTDLRCFCYLCIIFHLLTVLLYGNCTLYSTYNIRSQPQPCGGTKRNLPPSPRRAYRTQTQT